MIETIDPPTAGAVGKLSCGLSAGHSRRECLYLFLKVGSGTLVPRPLPWTNIDATPVPCFRMTKAMFSMTAANFCAMRSQDAFTAMQACEAYSRGAVLLPWLQQAMCWSA